MSDINTEGDLVKRLQARSGEAMNEFYQQYGELMYLAVRRVVGDGEAADDILQKSLIKCWESIGTYDISKSGRLRVWASNVSRYLAINHLRRQAAAKRVKSVSPEPTHLNARMKDQNGQRYEIYWTTAGAKHILDNYLKDIRGGVHHGIDHTFVSKLLKTARFVVALPEDPRPLLHVCLSGYKGQVYETYVYLVPELDHRPQRCVVVSSYVSNKQQYRKLFDN